MPSCALDMTGISCLLSNGWVAWPLQGVVGSRYRDRLYVPPQGWTMLSNVPDTWIWEGYFGVYVSPVVHEKLKETSALRTPGDFYAEDKKNNVHFCIGQWPTFPQLTTRCGKRLKHFTPSNNPPDSRRLPRPRLCPACHFGISYGEWAKRLLNGRTGLA